MAKKFEKDPDAVLLQAKGSLLYPHIIQPKTQVWNNKEKVFKESADKAKHKYETGLIMDADDAGTKTLMDKIDSLFKVARTRAEAVIKEKYPKQTKFTDDDFVELCPPKKKPYTIVKDEAGEPTGDIKFQFNQKAYSVFEEKDGTKTTKSKPLHVFDTKGNLITNKNLKPGSGTVAKIMFEASPYAKSGLGYGVSLKLKGIVILKFEAYQASGGVKFSDFDLELEEGEDEFDINDFDMPEEESKHQDDKAESSDDDDDSEDGEADEF